MEKWILSIILIGILFLVACTLVETGAGIPNYQCAATNEEKYCDRLGTNNNPGLRCYPEAGTTRGYKDCNSGWETLVTPQQINAPIQFNHYIYQGPDWYFILEDEPGKCLKRGLVSQKVNCP